MGEKLDRRQKVIRLHVFCEGQSEESFVNELLVDHFVFSKVFASASAFTTSSNRGIGKQYKGGINSYKKIYKEIKDMLSKDKNPDFRLSTMIDLYGLPSDFPGYEEARSMINPYARVEILEEALAEDIDDPRFIPYIQLHEFEALIFSDPAKLEKDYLDYEKEISELVILSEKHNPEEINDNPNTAPSKRIIAAIPVYKKHYSASSIAKEIGLEKMRKRCKHFNKWLTRLENLSQTSLDETKVKVKY